jgi:hypothetical protein
MLRDEVRDLSLPLLRFIDLRGGRAPETTHPLHINCRQQRLSLTGGAHYAETARRVHVCAIITARQPKGRGGPSRPPPTTPTTRAVAPPEKARPLRTTTATIVGI